MRSSSKIILVIAIIACGLFCQHVQAVQITGNITFTGTCSLNTKSASTATMVTGWHGLGAGGLPQVASHDGSFNGSVTDGDVDLPRNDQQRRRLLTAPAGPRLPPRARPSANRDRAGLTVNRPWFD